VSLYRLPRAFALFGFWWMWIFIIPDHLWPHIPPWVDLIRTGTWIWLVMYDHLPGYRRFVQRSGFQASAVVPETPTAPLVGWRAWRIGGGRAWQEEDGPRSLMSLTSPEKWPAGEPIRATCTRSWLHGPTPGPDCHCGIHAFAGPSEASVIRLTRRIAVYGPVLMWGRTQVHETGWRSQYAYPLALVRPQFLLPSVRHRMNLILDGLGKEYGIPVLSRKDAKLLAERMAPPNENRGSRK
jgi:hypothetical protein